MINGVELIAAERELHPAKGWSAEHDDEHERGDLSRAAMAYTWSAWGQACGVPWEDIEARVPNTWPWSDDQYKPSPDPVRNLVKAGALIAAEIDRLQRAAS